MAKTRVNLYFDDLMLKRIDTEAKEMGVSRTAAISMMVSQFLNQKKTIDVASNMMGFIQNKTSDKFQSSIYDILDDKSNDK